MMRAMATQRTEPAYAPLAAVPRGASTYWLDADDRVVKVNRAWREFAEANGAPTLPALVIGREVWDFIGGTHLRQLMREVFDHARHTGRAMRIQYHCDAPAVVRTFTLHLRPIDNDRLECASELIAESRRSPVVLLDAEHDREGERMITICSWCKRAHVGEWVDLEEAVRLLGLLREDPTPPISHGLCPDCDRTLRANLE